MATALDKEETGVNMGGTWIGSLRFADDIGLMAETPLKLQDMVSRLLKESINMGIKINMDKTDSVHWEEIQAIQHRN